MDGFFRASLNLVRSLQGFIESPLWTGVWLYMSQFIMGLAILSIVFFYICVDRKSGYYFSISTLSALFVSSFLKPLVCEPRPFVRDMRIRNVDHWTATGYSFPSGHCTGIASTSAAFFSYYRAILSYYVAYFWVANVFAIISRIVLGSHYLHDCLAGFAIGLAVGYFVLQLNTSSYIFFERNGIWIGAILFAIGLSGALLGQFGFSFFVSMENAFHFLSAIGCIAMGDYLERRLIGCACYARNMKKFIRFVFFVATVWLMYEVYFMVFSRTILSFHIFIVLLSFYYTLGFSWLGSVLMLFDKQT